MDRVEFNLWHVYLEKRLMEWNPLGIEKYRYRARIIDSSKSCRHVTEVWGDTRELALKEAENWLEKYNHLF